MTARADRKTCLFGRQQVFEASSFLLAAPVLLEPCEPNAAGIRNSSS
jgi:hypothetical protein